jgi:alpha/beta superfamily hydrolase
MTEVIFKGPGYKLKGNYFQSDYSHSPVALVLYPKTKTNEIPDSIKVFIDVLKANNFSIFTFNFDRVGDVDESMFDSDFKKERELFEIISVLNWIANKHYDKKNLWLLSFYSSCWVGLQIVMRRPEIDDYILISPLQKIKDFTSVVPCSSNGLIIYESDLPNSVDEAIEKLLNKSKLEIKTMPFTNLNIEKNQNLDKVLNSFDEYLKKRLFEDNGKTKKIKRDRRKRKKRSTTEEKNSIRVPPIKSVDFE